MLWISDSASACADQLVDNSNLKGNMKMKAFKFIRQLSDGSKYHLGTAVEYPSGWRFISNTQHKGSRKYHPTMEKCIPRWVGYPKKCEMIETTPVTDWPNVETDMQAWKDWAEAGE